MIPQSVQGAIVLLSVSNAWFVFCFPSYQLGFQGLFQGQEFSPDELSLALLNLLKHTQQLL